MKIKRIIALFIASALLICAAGCGSKSAQGFSSDSLCIVCNGKTFRVGDKADKLLKELGTPAGTTSQASCHYAMNGDEYTYEYYYGSGDYSAIVTADGGNEDPADLGRFGDILRIHTVPLKPGTQYICDIDCYTSRFATDKGIASGSSRDDVIKAYGSGFTDEGGGYLTYYDGEPLPDTPRLMFYLENDKVVFFSVSAAINF